jgi:hypothetical protein
MKMYTGVERAVHCCVILEMHNTALGEGQVGFWGRGLGAGARER